MVGEVRVDTADLVGFVDSGLAYVLALQGLSDDVAWQRSVTRSALGGHGPDGLVALSASSMSDPMARLVEQAVVINGFAASVVESLGNYAGPGSVSPRTVDAVGRALKAAGDRHGSVVDDPNAWALTLLAQSDDADAAGVRLALYEARIAAGETIDLADVIEADRAAVADTIIDHNVDVIRAEDTTDSEAFGLAMSQLHWLNVQAQQIGGEVASQVGHRFVQTAIGIESQIGFASEADRPRQVLATAMANQGIALVTPAERADLVAALHQSEVSLPGWPLGARRSGLEVLVEALDLDNDEWVFVPFNTDDTQTRHHWRIEAAERLVAATQRPDGTLSVGGTELFDLVVADLMAYDASSAAAAASASVVDLTDESLVAGSRYLDGQIRRFNLRDTLIRSTTAPNYGLSSDEYALALRIDELLTNNSNTRADASISTGDDLGRQIELDVLLTSFSGDDETQQMLVGLIAGGVPITDAIRIARSSPTPQRTDQRVEVLRYLLPLDGFGNPALPYDSDGNPIVDGFAAAGLDVDAAQSAAAELSVLQSIQIARHNDGLPSATTPLTAEQLALVDGLYQHWGLIQQGKGEWWTQRRRTHHRATRPNTYVTLAAIARGGLTEIAGRPVTTDLRSLAVQLTDPANDDVWAVLYAADGDEWFGADGTYQTGGFDISDISQRHGPRQRLADIDTDAFDRLAVQLFLLDQLGPSASLLADADGNVTEDTVNRYLKRHGHDLPPVLADRLQIGLQYGLGHDTFGWDEIAEIAGWAGLTVAAALLFVPSAGSSAWVTAGLVGLAGFEGYAAYRAGDNVGATLALAGAVADGATAARFIANSLRTGQASAEEVTALLALANNPGALAELPAHQLTAISRRVNELANLTNDRALIAAIGSGADTDTVLTEFHRLYRTRPEQLINALVADGADPITVLTIRHQTGLPLISPSGATQQAIDWLRLSRLEHNALYAGLPIPAWSKNVATMHTSLQKLGDPALIRETQRLLRQLNRNPQIAGLDAWAGAMMNRNPKSILDATHELRAMHALANDYPGHTIKVDNDLTTGGTSSFDIEIIDPNGTTTRYVEVHHTGTVTKQSDINEGVRHAAAKVPSTQSSSTPRVAANEARVVVRIEPKLVVLNGSKRIETDPTTGDYVHYIRQDRPDEKAKKRGNLFDDYVSENLNGKPAGYVNLDSVVVVSLDGTEIARLIRNPNGDWTRA